MNLYSSCLFLMLMVIIKGGPSLKKNTTTLFSTQATRDVKALMRTLGQEMTRSETSTLTTRPTSPGFLASRDGGSPWVPRNKRSGSCWAQILRRALQPLKTATCPGIKLRTPRQRSPPLALHILILRRKALSQSISSWKLTWWLAMTTWSQINYGWRCWRVLAWATSRQGLVQFFPVSYFSCIMIDVLWEKNQRPLFEMGPFLSKIDVPV